MVTFVAKPGAPFSPAVITRTSLTTSDVMVRLD